MDSRQVKSRPNRRTIVIVDIPENFADKKTINQHFSQFGPITRISLKSDFSSAKVCFKNEDDARNAAQNGDVWRDELLTILDWPPSTRESSRDEPKCYDDISYDFDIDSEDGSALASGLSNRDDRSYQSTKRDSDSGLKKIRSTRRIMLKHLKDVSPSRVTKIKRSIVPERKVVSLNQKKPLKKLSTHKSSKHEKSKGTNSKTQLSPKAFKSMVAETLKDKLFILNERDKYLKKLLLKNSGSKAPVKGTCPDMCPEKERIMREYRGLISIFEAKEDCKGMAPELAIKEYSRSSADQEEPLPHELRPEPVLTMTMSYLINYIIPEIDNPNLKESVSDWFDFCWDRLRGIRKDITQQQLLDESIVNIIEQCARFHIACYDRLYGLDMKIFDEKINRENIMNCLSSLNHMYNCLSSSPNTCTNEAEFKAYQILLQLNNGDVLWEFQNFPAHIQDSQALKTAVQAYLMYSSRSYSQFFDLVEKTTYLNSCLLQTYFPVIRRSALSIIIKAYSPPIKTVSLNASFFKQSLRISDQELDFFCKNHGINFNSEINEIIFSRDELSIKELTFYFDNSSYVVINKRKPLPVVVVNSDTLPSFIPHEVHSSFQDNGKLSGLALQAIDQEIKLKQDFGLSYRPLNSTSEIQIDSDSDVQIISDDECSENASEGEPWPKGDSKFQVVEIDDENDSKEDENDIKEDENESSRKQQPLSIFKKETDFSEVEEAQKCLMKNLEKGKNIEEIFRKEKEWTLKEEERRKNTSLSDFFRYSKLSAKTGNETSQENLHKFGSTSLEQKHTEMNVGLFKKENSLSSAKSDNTEKQMLKRHWKFEKSDTKNFASAPTEDSKKFCSFFLSPPATADSNEAKDTSQEKREPSVFGSHGTIFNLPKQNVTSKLFEELKNRPPNFSEGMTENKSIFKEQSVEEKSQKTGFELKWEPVKDEKYLLEEKIKKEKLALELVEIQKQEIEKQRKAYEEENLKKYLEKKKIEEEERRLKELEAEKEMLKRQEEENERLRKLQEEEARKRLEKLEEERKEEERQKMEEALKLKKQKEEFEKQLLQKEKEVELNILKGYLSQQLKVVTVKHYAKLWKRKIDALRQSKINFPALVRLSVDENLALWGTVGNRSIIPPLKTFERFNRLKLTSKLISKLNQSKLDVEYIGDILAESIVDNNLKANSNTLINFIFCKLVFVFFDSDTYDEDFIKFVKKCLTDALFPKGCNFSRAFSILTSHNIPVFTSVDALSNPSDFEVCHGMNGLVLFSTCQNIVELKMRICKILSHLKCSVPIPLIIVTTNQNSKSVLLSEFLDQLKVDKILIHWIIHTWSNWFNFCKEFVSTISHFNLASSNISVNNFFTLMKILVDEFFSFFKVSCGIDSPNDIIKLYNKFLIKVEQYLISVEHQDIPLEFKPLLIESCNPLVNSNNAILNNDSKSLKVFFNNLTVKEFIDWPPKSIEQLLKILEIYSCGNEQTFSQIVRLLDLSYENGKDINFYLERAPWTKIIELLVLNKIEKSRESNIFVVYKMKDLLGIVRLFF